MVEKSVIMETIKRMLASDIDDDTIVSTLTDTGISEAEAKAYLAEARGAPAAAPKPKPEKGKEEKVHEKIAEKTAEKVKKHLDEARTETELRETTTHAALEEQRAKLHEMHKEVKGISEKISTTPTQAAEQGSFSSQALIDLQKDMSDVKAATSALQSLLQKILSTNREVLMQLQKKK